MLKMGGGNSGKVFSTLQKREECLVEGLWKLGERVDRKSARRKNPRSAVECPAKRARLFFLFHGELDVCADFAKQLDRNLILTHQLDGISQGNFTLLDRVALRRQPFGYIT